MWLLIFFRLAQTWLLLHLLFEIIIQINTASWCSIYSRAAFTNISAIKCGVYLRAAFNWVNMVVKLRLSGARVLVCDFHGYLGPQSGLNCRSYITNHLSLLFFLWQMLSWFSVRPRHHCKSIKTNIVTRLDQIGGKVNDSFWTFYFIYLKFIRSSINSPLKILEKRPTM